MSACCRTRVLLGAPRLLLVLLLLPAAADWAQSGAQVPPDALEQEVARLKARVAASLASEQQLVATNAELRREVSGWVDVGKKVLDREAHIVEAVKQGGDGAVVDQASLRAAVLAGWSQPVPEQKLPLNLATRSAVQTEIQAVAGAVQEYLPSQLVSWHFLVLMLTVLAAIAFCVVRAPARLKGFLSREKHIQLSELQLEGASMGFGEGYLLVEPSGALRTRTRFAAQKEGSSVLRFDEVLTLTVWKGSGPCVFTVYRRGQHQDMRVGTVSLQASEILSCVAASCQYFRFNVQPDASSREQELRVACRIRDLPEPATQQAGFSSRMKSMAHVV